MLLISHWIRSFFGALAILVASLTGAQTIDLGANELPDEVAQLIEDYRYTEAFPRLMELSKRGNQEATFFLGNYYVCGRVAAFNCQEAERLFELALIARNGSPLDPEILRSTKNEIAWLHASCEQPGFVRNVPMALRFAQAAVTDAWDPFALDTLAAVHARAGEFERAVEVQRRAVSELGKMPTSPPIPQYTIDEFNARVAKYQAREVTRVDESNYRQNCNMLPDRP